MCVEVTMGAKKQRSNVAKEVKKSANWNNTKLDFGIVAASVSDMTINLINTADLANGGKEDHIASGTFPITSGERWYSLKPKGEIKVLVQGR